MYLETKFDPCFARNDGRRTTRKNSEREREREKAFEQISRFAESNRDIPPLVMGITSERAFARRKRNKYDSFSLFEFFPS